MRAAHAATIAAFVIAALAASAARCAGEADARDVALANAGFEGGQSASGHPQGWAPMQHVTVDAYRFVVDQQVKHSGAKSLRIARDAAEPFGSIVQRVSDATLRGRTVRFSAWLRTQDAATGSGAGGGALIVQAFRGGALAAYEHMRASPVKGTSDWRQYSITLAIPADADAVEVGAMLVGPGTLWFDDARLEIAAP